MQGGISFSDALYIDMCASSWKLKAALQKSDCQKNKLVPIKYFNPYFQTMGSNSQQTSI